MSIPSTNPPSHQSADALNPSDNFFRVEVPVRKSVGESLTKILIDLSNIISQISFEESSYFLLKGAGVLTSGLGGTAIVIIARDNRNDLIEKIYKLKGCLSKLSILDNNEQALFAHKLFKSKFEESVKQLTNQPNNVGQIREDSSDNSIENHSVSAQNNPVAPIVLTPIQLQIEIDRKETTLITVKNIINGIEDNSNLLESSKVGTVDTISKSILTFLCLPTIGIAKYDNKRYNTLLGLIKPYEVFLKALLNSIPTLIDLKANTLVAGLRLVNRMKSKKVDKLLSEKQKNNKEILDLKAALDNLKDDYCGEAYDGFDD